MQIVLGESLCHTMYMRLIYSYLLTWNCSRSKTKQKRLERATALLRCFKFRDKSTSFSLMKNFYLNPTVTSQNNRIWASGRKAKTFFKPHFSNAFDHWLSQEWSAHRRLSVRLFVCVCIHVSVCLQHNSKTNGPKVLMWGSNDLPYPTSIMVFKWKGQRSRSQDHEV